MIYNVYISSDKPPDSEEKKKICSLLEEKYSGLGFVINIVNDYRPIDSAKTNLAALSERINLLALADLAVFTKDWAYSRECRIEKSCCTEFEIPVLYMKEG